MGKAVKSVSKLSFNWSELVPDHEWKLYSIVLNRALEQGIRFALGGGLAFSYYSRRLRNTKDIDLFILPEDREKMIDIVTESGFEDYYEKEPYDRKWIYRGYRENVICDLIWQMANYRTDVDERWVTRGEEFEASGMRLKLLPVEELIWSKLYVMQRERCDWPDLLNLLNAQAENIDWNHLLSRLEDDIPLMSSVVSLFGWMCPDRAQSLPEWLWDRLRIYKPLEGPSCSHDTERIRLLDSRDWFGPSGT
jgi:predicted nucleotidyltransferase